MDMQNYTIPFANSGDVEEFSIGADPSGKVSLEKGWTELYQIGPEEGGLFILRRVFNQMMKLVSTDTVTWKTQSFPNWIDDKGDGLPFAYPKNAIIKYTNGNTYVSLVDNNTQIPTGANWKLFDITSLDNTVKLSGNQTIAGVKTFSSNIVGSITGNSGTATKLQTARTINGVAFDGTANITVSDSTAVKLTGNQTIAGVKTFSSSPIVPTPTTNTQVANKDYVDSQITSGSGVGAGQTWQNMTSSRSKSVTYTNSTGKPIVVSANVNSTTNTTTYLDLTINGMKVYSNNTQGMSGTQIGISGIVPSGSTYEINSSSAIASWYELR